MRKADFILDKCKKYNDLVSRAAGPLPSVPMAAFEHPMPMIEPGIGTGKFISPVIEPFPRAVEPFPSVVENSPHSTTTLSDLGKGPGYEPTAPKGMPLEAPVRAPGAIPGEAAGVTAPVEVPLPYKGVVNIPWVNKRGPAPKGKIRADGKLEVYLDEKERPIIESLPDELKTEGNIDDVKAGKGDFPKHIIQDIFSSVRTNKIATIKGKWYSPDISLKAEAIADWARLNKFKIYAAGAAASIVLGGLVYLLTGKEPASTTEVGNKLKYESIFSVSGIDKSKVTKNTDLQTKLQTISSLAKSYSDKQSIPQNKETLKSIANELDILSNNLILNQFAIDDNSSAQNAASRISLINNNIKSIFSKKYLERFAKFLQKQNDTSNLSLVESCEVDLANYQELIKESGSVAKSMKNIKPEQKVNPAELV